jgi:7-carboxy-7-deazaguanine synthase
MKNEQLFVSEIFGPTFQGEGRSLGMPCMFLRLGGCNLACTFCDTPYTWDWLRFDPRQEVQALSLDEVHARLEGGGVRNLVVSGGEPMLQQAALLRLTRRLHEEGWWTEMETAGTVAPAAVDLVRAYTVSPKLASSGNLGRPRLVHEALCALRDTGRASWKFVVTGPEDFSEIDTLVRELGLGPVYIMPEGTEAEALKARLIEMAPLCAARGYHLTPRLHILLYGNRRGV